MITTEAVEFEGSRTRPTGTIDAAVSDEALQTLNVGGRSDPEHVSNRRSYHPGTRVRVDAQPRLSPRFLRSRAGVAFAQGMLARLRERGYWPFRICFEDVAREHPNPGGKALLRLTIGSDGTVLHARLLKTELKQQAIALCHVAAARHLRLEPNRMRRFDVDVSVGVWPGDVPLLPPPKPPMNVSKADREALSQWVKNIESDVVRCMQIARDDDPMLWGRLALSFAIDERGHPSAPSEFLSQFGDQKAVECVAKRLEALEFPLPKQDNLRLTAAWRLHRPAAPAVEGEPQMPISASTADPPTLAPEAHPPKP
jgi:hypothetical protein